MTRNQNKTSNNKQATRQGRIPRCSLCLVHKVVTSQRGHKYTCPFRACPCEGCTKVNLRRKEVREQVFHMRQRKVYGERMDMREPQGHRERNHNNSDLSPPSTSTAPLPSPPSPPSEPSNHDQREQTFNTRLRMLMAMIFNGVMSQVGTGRGDGLDRAERDDPMAEDIDNGDASEA